MPRKTRWERLEAIGATGDGEGRAGQDGDGGTTVGGDKGEGNTVGIKRSWQAETGSEDTVVGEDEEWRR